MGGKRPDQYNIAPSEAGTTDYKRYPEATHGVDQDLSTDGDKRRLAQQEASAQSQEHPQALPFPPAEPAPSVHANAGRKEGERENGEDANTETGKENPLA